MQCETAVVHIIFDTRLLSCCYSMSKIISVIKIIILHTEFY